MPRLVPPTPQSPLTSTLENFSTHSKVVHRNSWQCSHLSHLWQIPSSLVNQCYCQLPNSQTLVHTFHLLIFVTHIVSLMNYRSSSSPMDSHPAMLYTLCHLTTSKLSDFFMVRTSSFKMLYQRGVGHSSFLKLSRQHIMYLHCTMIYDQLGLTIGLSLWASWGQAGLQGVAIIYGPAQVYQVSPYHMV